ncbi:MAG TPA: DUF2911 domain-containing protein [Alphaproteobacteria bacterium]|nr:DUF2911 domain-containing protein [Alphaproteobacteria bacterium]
MRNRKWSIAASVLALALSLSLDAQQPSQDKSKRPSPPGTASIELKGKKVTIDYSRPSVRGRKIMGELVPYGQVWRTGANEATTLTTGTDLNIGGAKVPAGTYTLYTLPGESAWKLIINKQTGQWGTEYDEAQDLVRIDMQKSATAKLVEQFTISFSVKDNNTFLVLEWENTRVSVPIKAQ